MCTGCQATAAIDAENPEVFAERLLSVLNHGAIAMMLSIGHRTGLFDSLEDGQAVTSQELANKAGLAERYVREWLGAMVTGEIVSHDGEAGTYWLTPERAAFLTRSAGGENLAQTMQWISLLGQVESEVTEAFTDGRGVPYASYDRFNEVMADESALTVVAALEEHILPLAPGTIERLEEGIDVLDVGCGVGRALIALAKRFPNSRFVGYDFLESAVTQARREAAEAGVNNARFEVQDAATFTDSDAFDLIFTFDAVHDQAKPDALLTNINQALRPDGVYLCQDIQGSSTHAGDVGHPIAPFIYTISCMHCMSVSLANDGAGLGAAWGRATAQKMFGEAGFRSVDVKELEHDFINYYYVCRKAA